ncbi:hypothetical protein PRABACTJOHN_03632 [Parabacteroides johnsonii DSM 18315]|jgi:hypothetical protein|uniref:Uncharacterized protein n=1 Tax=Parabacteroides johnsonii DSM 18315 TaxID=537006 RepID=B7BF03_9BACT|nr:MULTISPECIES: hypothetical protein [Bacteroidales]EEC94965.1 hypothetical protein PRABACTJOHN_03632 [Parabacteroides johnsonii DSM 18315]UEA91034.1 hypothetical protein LK449_02085 [Parabacteroides johnsonii]UWP43188.1 hypothetical protein NQ564_01050 [Parabacteroides johnsonii DSM 18315]
MIVVFLPSVRLPYSGAASGFMVHQKAVGKASPAVFSCQLLLPGKEEFARNALQNSGTGTTAYLCSDKTYAVTVRRARREKSAALAAIKGKRQIEKETGGGGVSGR